MTTIKKTSRNLALAALLWAAGIAAAPATVSARYCDYEVYYANWAGRCAPGGQDACGYFEAECQYTCFSNWAGQLCYVNFSWCDQYNAQSEWDPLYCLSSGWCACRIDY
jgi:hypothetical protein